VELQDAAARRDYTARELDGKERETWWAPAAIPSAAALCVRDSPLDLHGLDPWASVQQPAAVARYRSADTAGHHRLFLMIQTRWPPDPSTWQKWASSIPSANSRD
jgi:hypothetical protein